MSKIDEHRDESKSHVSIAAYFSDPASKDRPIVVRVTGGCSEMMFGRADVPRGRPSSAPPFAAGNCIRQALQEMLPALAARVVAIHAEQVEALRREAMRECEDFVANGGRLSAPIPLPHGEEVEDEEGEA